MKNLVGYLVLEDKVVYGKLIIEDGRIKKIKLKEEDNNSKVFIMPGFIDQHIHGAGGCDVMDGTFESINTISQIILKEGVTSFLPTTMTASSKNIELAIENIFKNKFKVNGANILGVHLEGPFINPQYKGAQLENYIIPFDLKEIDKWNKNKIIKIITTAPEIEGFGELLNYAKKHNIKISIGHSAATYQQAQDAINKGVSGFTHAFNAMSKFNHREVGMVGAMLISNNTYAELISDLVHVSKPAIKLLFTAKGVRNIILISDAMRGKGLLDGISELGGQRVIIKEGVARLESGNLAGSVLKFNEGIKNISQTLKLSLVELSHISSLNAAINLGVSDRKGSISIGKDADLVILDENFNVIKTIVGGNVLYEK